MKISRELQRWMFEQKMRVFKPLRQTPPQPPSPQVVEFQKNNPVPIPLKFGMTTFRNCQAESTFQLIKHLPSFKLLFPEPTTDSSIWRNKSLPPNPVFQSFSRCISTSAILGASKCKTISELCTKKKESCKKKKECPPNKITCPDEGSSETKCQTDCLPKSKNSSEKRSRQAPEKQDYPPIKCPPSKFTGPNPCPCKVTPKEVGSEVPVKKACPPPPPLPKSPSKPIVLCPCPPPPKLPPTSCPCVPEIVNEVCENEKSAKACPPKPKKPCNNSS